MLESHEEKLRKILLQKEKEFKNFKKRISFILSEHNNTAEGVQNNAVSISQFKCNV
jgi:hypothetical protein